MSGAACLGGFCQIRSRCGRHLQEDRAVVVERLCERGRETLHQATDGVMVRKDGWVELMTPEAYARSGARLGKA
jgi:hypothetical protein